jgi:hypothetical protein
MRTRHAVFGEARMHAETACHALFVYGSIIGRDFIVIEIYELHETLCGEDTSLASLPGCSVGIVEFGYCSFCRCWQYGYTGVF